MRNPALSQKTRFILLLIEAAILCLASWIAFGKLAPPDGEKGFWFYSALLGLILGARLDTPFYAKPADVVLYAAPAAIALALVSSTATWDSGTKVAFALAVTFCIIVGLLGAAAILLNDTKPPKLQQLSKAVRVLSETLGAPRVIYTVVILFAIYAFHAQSPIETRTILIAWILTAVLSPLESSVKVGRRLMRIFKPYTIIDADGEVVAYQTPGLILIRQSASSTIKGRNLLAVHDPLGKIRIALALDHVGRDEGMLLRTIEIEGIDVPVNLEDQMFALSENAAVCLPADVTLVGASDLVKEKNSIVGLVAADTTVEKLYFEVVKDDGLEEGRLVEVNIGGRKVTYQLVNGLSKEEVVQQKNTHGFVRAQAQKIGEWDGVAKRFKLIKWLPKPNSPVLLKSTTEFQHSSDAVGHFPGTDYPVSIKNINELVTHNTAILGILGVGKSMLAIELVERMIASGIKVVCLDLTNQYADELSDFYDKDYEQICLARIQEAGSKDIAAFADNPEDGGSIPNLRDAMQADLIDFLREDNPRYLKIYNPAQVVGSKQIKEPSQYKVGAEWKRGAALWSLTPVEVTRLVSETVLALLQDKMSVEARVCLVYEEAHSLVPEFTSVASPSDKEACNATARAILQGRKFGLGCLLITQRTANVTKTILNQCNTVFAMRTFDETGKEFLSNYIGRDYACTLSSLAERHAVLFGKASSCENPILIRLNDRDKFIDSFRPNNPAPNLNTPIAAAVAPLPPKSFDGFDDDIPF